MNKEKERLIKSLMNVAEELGLDPEQQQHFVKKLMESAEEYGVEFKEDE